MKNIRLLPKHTFVGSSIDYGFSSLIEENELSFKHKGLHHSKKYDPRVYLKLIKEKEKEEENRFSPMLYDYRIIINTSSLPSVEKPRAQKHQRNNWKTNLSATSNNSIDPSVDCLYEHQPHFQGKEYGDLGEGILSKKERARKKWMKLCKRTIFSFEIDSKSNLISLIRKKHESLGDVVRETVKTKKHVEGISLSPCIQKKKGIEQHIQNCSIDVFYTLNKDVPKLTCPIYNSTEINKQFLKYNLKDNLKLGVKIKRILRGEKLESSFDFNKMNLREISNKGYISLYWRVKKALIPTFYNTGNDELNNIDPDISHILLSNNTSTIPLTSYDNQILEMYKSYKKKAESNKLMTIFWQAKKTKGTKPTSRECPGIINYKGKMFIFGGYGADHMNDLWCLSNGKWLLTKLSGHNYPEGRYGHCMVVYKENIYIFGGSSEFITNMKLRLVLKDFWKYSIEDNHWSQIDASSYTHRARMHAGSCVLQELWFIYGGTDGNGKNYMTSTITYDVGKLLSYQK